MSDAVLSNADATLELTAEQLRALTARGTRRRYPAGSLLFAEGDPSGPMFVLERGSVTIRTSSGITSTIDRPGDVFGELAALAAIPRRASVTADTDADLVVVAPAQLLSLMADDEALAERVHAIAAARSDSPPWHGSIELNGCPADELAEWVLSHQSFDRSLASISGDLGVSQELVTRAVDYLVARGALAVDRGRLVVRSTDVLAQVVEQRR